MAQHETSTKARMVGDWKLEYQLGEGLQGEVFLAKNTKTGTSSALKFLFKDKMREKSMQNLRREVAAMESVKDCANVVKMIGVEWDAKFPSGGTTRDAVCINLELCDGGELFNYLMFTGFFDEKLGRTYFRMLIDGLSSLHSKGFTHRDIKPENVLLDKFVLKIADFGFSAKHELEPGRLTKLRTQCGTKGYMAPELIDFTSYSGYSGPPVDVWAAGVLLFVMLVGSPPMSEASAGDWWFDRLAEGNHELFWRAHEQTGHVISDQAKDLILKMLAPDVGSRLTLAEVKAHPWYSGEVFSVSEVEGELQTRKQIVEKKREEERRKKMMERHRRNKRRQGQGFNPFARNVVRSASKEEETVIVPAAPARLPLTHCLLPISKPAEAWACVQKTIGSVLDSAVESSCKEDDKFAKGFIGKAGSSTFTFRASIYTREKALLLSLSRQNGDLMAFNRMFTLLSNKLYGGEPSRPVGVLLPPSAALLAESQKTATVRAAT